MIINIATGSDKTGRRVFTLQDHSDHWEVIVRQSRYEGGRDRSVAAAIFRPSKSYDSQGYRLTEDEARGIFAKRTKK